MVPLLLWTALLSRSATSAFSRHCPVEEGNECDKDTWAFVHMCCGDLDSNEDCCKTFTNDVFVIFALGYGVFVGLTYMLFRRSRRRNPTVHARHK
ncbi:hypothetical protein Y032_0045g1114 [Ancylostoma ceylanicum]|uniref:Uncharacterized protein n=1 Tax=Ancylostoma ceylanicum TaxID=53326 RepID=A0A016UD20_9BILA|nr:hypothetical protein Y032_0045g1114 [Ancylostoma ceylanicum]